jgi:excinuclease UvrABC ATPase subunit
VRLKIHPLTTPECSSRYSAISWIRVTLCNLDVVKSADHLIDIGPEGGDAGGEIIATGTPEKIAATRESYTGQFLKPILQRA